MDRQGIAHRGRPNICQASDLVSRGPELNVHYRTFGPIRRRLRSGVVDPTALFGRTRGALLQVYHSRYIVGAHVHNTESAALFAATAGKVGLDRELSAALRPWMRPLAIHDPGKVLLDFGDLGSDRRGLPCRYRPGPY